jgi:SAM-dependent methyltransferase
MTKHQHEFDDWDVRVDELEREGEIGLPWFESATDWVASVMSTGRDAGRGADASTDPSTEASQVRRVLDVGAGPGVASCVLAERFPAAQVTAVDSAPGLLTRVMARSDRLGVGDRMDTLELSLDGDLADLPEADLIWASRVLHHVPDQPKALLALGSRLRRPSASRTGGLLAIAEPGLATRFLPEENGVGAPGLLDRLDAAVSTGLATRLHHDASSPVPRPVLDWPAQLAEAGLAPAGSRSFLLDLPAPVSQAVREHVALRLGRTASLAGEHLSSADAASIEQLLDRENPLGVWRRPDLFLLSAVTVHAGRRTT